MARGPYKLNAIVPPLTFFEQADLWKYSLYPEMWPELEAALLDSSFEEFRVVNDETRGHQERMRVLVDTSMDQRVLQQGSLHCLAQHTDVRVAVLMRGLLQLGANPDLVATGNGNRTPSHRCAYYGSVEVAEALLLCRPDLRAKNRDGDTPAALAHQEGNLVIAKMFDDAEMDGFPTIAQLAEMEKWWAVHNLCRRGVVPEQEKFALHKGKDAIGWAVHHQKFDVIEELGYLLKVVVQPRINEGLLETLAVLKAEVQKIKTEKDTLEQILDKQAAHVVEQHELIMQTMSKKEGNELKEMLVVNLTKTSDDYQDLKKELAALRKQVNSKLKTDHKVEQPTKQMNMIRSKALPEEWLGSRRAPCAAGPHTDSKAGVDDKKDEKIATLEAENKALKEKFSQLQEAYKTQAALFSSFSNKGL